MTETSHTPANLVASSLPNKTIAIRSFNPADQAVVLELFAAGMRLYTPRGDNSDEAAQNWLDFIDKSLKDDLADIKGFYFASNGHFWVATSVDDDGQEVVVGMVGLKARADMVYEVRRLAVRADYRRYGVGKQLMAHLEQWGRDQGVQKVWLSTAVIAVTAQKFYPTIGYTQTKIEVYPEFPLFEVVVFEKELEQ